MKGFEMKFCDREIQNHLLNGGKIINESMINPIYLNINELVYDNPRLGCQSLYRITKGDLISNSWRIVEPEYNYDKIIKDEILCVFWDSDPKACAIGYLKYCDLSAVFKYHRDDATGFQNCKPFNPNDYDITDNLKEYEL